MTDPNICKLGAIAKVSKKAFRSGVGSFLTLTGLKVIEVFVRETKRSLRGPLGGARRLHAGGSPPPGHLRPFATILDEKGRREEEKEVKTEKKTQKQRKILLRLNSNP